MYIDSYNLAKSFIEENRIPVWVRNIRIIVNIDFDNEIIEKLCNKVFNLGFKELSFIFSETVTIDINFYKKLMLKYNSIIFGFVFKNPNIFFDEKDIIDENLDNPELQKFKIKIFLVKISTIDIISKFISFINPENIEYINFDSSFIDEDLKNDDIQYILNFVTDNIPKTEKLKKIKLESLQFSDSEDFLEAESELHEKNKEKKEFENSNTNQEFLVNYKNEFTLTNSLENVEKCKKIIVDIFNDIAKLIFKMKNLKTISLNTNFNWYLLKDISKLQFIESIYIGDFSSKFLNMCFFKDQKTIDYDFSECKLKELNYKSNFFTKINIKFNKIFLCDKIIIESSIKKLVKNINLYDLNCNKFITKYFKIFIKSSCNVINLNLINSVSENDIEYLYLLFKQILDLTNDTLKRIKINIDSEFYNWVISMFDYGKLFNSFNDYELKNIEKIDISYIYHNVTQEFYFDFSRFLNLKIIKIYVIGSNLYLSNDQIMNLKKLFCNKLITDNLRLDFNNCNILQVYSYKNKNYDSGKLIINIPVCTNIIFFTLYNNNEEYNFYEKYYNFILRKISMHEKSKYNLEIYTQNQYFNNFNLYHHSENDLKLNIKNSSFNLFSVYSASDIYFDDKNINLNVRTQFILFSPLEENKCKNSFELSVISEDLINSIICCNKKYQINFSNVKSCETLVVFYNIPININYEKIINIKLLFTEITKFTIHEKLKFLSIVEKPQQYKNNYLFLDQVNNQELESHKKYDNKNIIYLTFKNKFSENSLEELMLECVIPNIDFSKLTKLSHLKLDSCNIRYLEPLAQILKNESLQVINLNNNFINNDEFKKYIDIFQAKDILELHNNNFEENELVELLAENRSKYLITEELEDKQSLKKIIKETISKQCLNIFKDKKNEITGNIYQNLLLSECKLCLDKIWIDDNKYIRLSFKLLFPQNKDVRGRIFDVFLLENLINVRASINFPEINFSYHHYFEICNMDDCYYSGIISNVSRKNCEKNINLVLQLCQAKNNYFSTNVEIYCERKPKIINDLLHKYFKSSNMLKEVTLDNFKVYSPRMANKLNDNIIIVLLPFEDINKDFPWMEVYELDPKILLKCKSNFKNGTTSWNLSKKDNKKSLPEKLDMLLNFLKLMYTNEYNHKFSNDISEEEKYKYLLEKRLFSTNYELIQNNYSKVINIAKFLVQKSVKEPYIYGLEIDNFTMYHMFNENIKDLILKDGLKSRYTISKENFKLQTQNNIFNYSNRGYLTEDYIQDFNINDDFVGTYFILSWYGTCHQEYATLGKNIIEELSSLNPETKENLRHFFIDNKFQFITHSLSKSMKFIYLNPRILVDHKRDKIKFFVKDSMGLKYMNKTPQSPLNEPKTNNFINNNYINPMTFTYSNLRLNDEDNLKLNLNLARAYIEIYNMEDFSNCNLEFLDQLYMIPNEMTVNNTVKLTKKYIKNLI